MKSSSKSIELDSLSGDTIYLSKHNFIHRPQQVVDAFVLYDNKYTYVPQPWLIDLYEKDPELFELNDRKDAKWISHFKSEMDLTEILDLIQHIRSLLNIIKNSA